MASTFLQKGSCIKKQSVLTLYHELYIAKRESAFTDLYSWAIRIKHLFGSKIAGCSQKLCALPFLKHFYSLFCSVLESSRVLAWQTPIVRAVKLGWSVKITNVWRKGQSYRWTVRSMEKFSHPWQWWDMESWRRPRGSVNKFYSLIKVAVLLALLYSYLFTSQFDSYVGVLDLQAKQRRKHTGKELLKKAISSRPFGINHVTV